ncbi:MAG: cupin domain-containing protein [Elusimicrobia bacterium]|nr:cupin domain-containing protein [Elusimicrobiota bacterium]
MSKIKITKKPWGEEHLFAATKRYAGKMIFIKKGHRLSLQYHTFKDESFYLLRGRMKISLGTDARRLVTKIIKPGQVVHVPAKTVHRTEALIACWLIEVSSPELSDIVRLDDDYNRINK